MTESGTQVPAGPEPSGGRRSLRVPLVALALLGLGLVVAAARRGEGAQQKQEQMLRTEEDLALFSGKLRDLEADLLDLEFPGERTRPWLAPRITANDLAPPREPAALEALLVGAVTLRDWAVGAAALRDSRGWSAWRAFLDRVAWFEHAHFALVRGEPLGPGRGAYAIELAFEAVAVLSSGARSQVRAELALVLRTDSVEADEPRWLAHELRTSAFQTSETPTPLFEEVLGKALPDRDELVIARRSIHEELVQEYILDGTRKAPRAWFRLPSNEEHPALAVVDWNGDGWDDLCVTPRWGRCLLYENRGDGTFREVGERAGLGGGDRLTSALFADFDNDGDPDLFLGSSGERGRYLVQEEGRFVDRTDELVQGELPYLVTSISAADYDGDGLLDVYFSTHASVYVMNAPELLAEYGLLPEDQGAELVRRTAQMDPWMDRPGPPNVLLRGVGGGRFEPALLGGPLETWHNTFQSTWADYDGDGDTDLYVANDFAPNNLYRNDGDGQFTDVTARTGTADVGFGMGASWGDYDLDGRQDLYVTNMYSKSGRRITAGLGVLGQHLAPGARGNSLLRNEGARFRRVSGTQTGTLLVEEAGWGWGGQFVDVDNDGYLDLHTLSGFYTAPKAVASLADT